MADRIPKRHLVLIAAAATAAVAAKEEEGGRKWKPTTRIRIRIPITIRPRKTAEPAPPQHEKKEKS